MAIHTTGTSDSVIRWLKSGYPATSRQGDVLKRPPFSGRYSFVACRSFSQKSFCKIFFARRICKTKFISGCQKATALLLRLLFGVAEIALEFDGKVAESQIEKQHSKSPDQYSGQGFSAIIWGLTVREARWARSACGGHIDSIQPGPMLPACTLSAALSFLNRSPSHS